MKHKNYIPIIFIIILTSCIVFLSKESLKKFTYMNHFITHNQNIIYWNYLGDKEPGMYNIVIKADKPFSVLLGFELYFPILQYTGSDPYGYITSSGNQIVISTYLGKKPLIFRFIPNGITKDNISITSHEEDQKLIPNIIYSPHRRQRIGFFS